MDTVHSEVGIEVAVAKLAISIIAGFIVSRLVLFLSSS